MNEVNSSKTVGIMQPTFIPWLGYFSMIKKSDEFVFLDNVQFEKKSWQNRNRIISQGNELFISLPVKTSGEFSQSISNVSFFESAKFDFRRKIWKTISSSYAKSKYYREICGLLEPLLLNETNSLSNYNIAIIKSISNYLQIDSTFHLGSKMKAKGAATNLTVNQCLELKATKFYCAEGARNYVSRQPLFAAHHISIEYQNFIHPSYPQISKKFRPYMSIVDALFNVGSGTKELI